MLIDLERSMVVNSRLFIQILYLLLCILFCSGCTGLEGAGKKLFEKLDPKQTGILFSNDLIKSDSLNIYEFDPFYNGGGVAIGDINNDGLSDIYFSGNMVTGKLYLNKGNFHFEDITEQAGITTKGWARGVAMADINGDGFLDVYICMAGSENLLFINQGNNTFIESAKAYGLNDASWATHAAFLDYDLDGDLDLYLITRSQELLKFSTVDPKPKRGESDNTDKLFRNNGNNTFTDVTAEAGVDFKGNGLGIVVTDVNNDFWPDVYIANDQVYNDFLYINNGDGTFTESASTYFKCQSFSGMGTDAADINNDGLVDICVVDMLPEDFTGQTLTIGDMRYDRFNRIVQNGYIPQYQRNVLQLNNGDGTFSEIAQLSGVDKTDWSWGVLFADFDNNGFKDIVVSTGMVKSLNNLDYIMYNRPPNFQANDPWFKKQFLIEMERLPEVKIPNRVFSNNGDLTFSNKTALWGLDEPTFSYGVAYADLDNDGDLDLVFSNVNDFAGIYENKTESSINSFLRVKVFGRAKNLAGYGAKVLLYNEGKVQMQEVSPFRGYQSTVENIIHFGIGNVSEIDSLVVIWPDKSYVTRRKLTSNQTILVKPEKENIYQTKETDEKAFAATKKFSFKHEDELFNDFAIQRTLPHGFSEYGPALSVGDVNGDGTVDVYLGGGKGQTGQIFLQQSDGSFVPAVGPVPKEVHETGALLTDFNGDGHPDLYVCVGGSGEQFSNPIFEDHLYLSNGEGQFFQVKNALPTFPHPSTVVVGADFDNDGDTDLFVGGGTVAERYPEAAPSRILRNNQGVFSNVTNEIAPFLDTLGLVTDARWVDFDGDGMLDLVVASKWNPVFFFRNVDGKFINVTEKTGLSGITGWWQSLAIADVDNDGLPDVIAGNYGHNSRLQPSREKPVSLISKDFDLNGRIDPLLFYNLDGTQRPVHTRDRLFDQIPPTRKKFPRYTSFTAATIETIFSPSEMTGARLRQASTFSSIVLRNNGDGTFTSTELPVAGQFAPVKSILPVDYDRDGNIDLVLAGNSETSDVFLGHHNAGYGVVLKGNGKGAFTPLWNRTSGFSAPGVVNQMVLIPSGDQNLLLLGRYRGEATMFLFPPAGSGFSAFVNVPDKFF